MRRIVFITVLLALPAVGFGATLYVPSNFPTIQDAIKAAVEGDTVLVDKGTYMENIDFKGKAILVTSEDGPEKTIIDGQSLTSVVRFQTGEGPDSIIE